jgi:hypothetical protein
VSSLRERLRGRSAALRERTRRFDRVSVAAGVVFTAAGIAVFYLASTVFGYHSSNHDEGVYLLQAAMLLEGQLELHAGELADAFHPWFFIEDDGRLYPKYSPVPAAMYAVSMALFGEPRVTLAAVAAGNAALVYLLGATVFDRRVGLVAAAVFSVSPLALVTSSVFLPYAPTTFLNLTFAVAYLRGVRDGSTVAAGIAGVSIGLAFFARPFTAVLFATPFILHALYRVGSSIRSDGGRPLPGPVRRQGLTAVLGLLFVGVTLAYNLRVTGSALLFPYEAFAPLDGPGFGRRRILGHSIVYTPSLALEANAHVLWYLATRWFTAGALGTAIALGGTAFSLYRWSRRRSALRPGSGSGPDAGFERTGGALLAGLLVTVPAGNLFFWGNFNVLATFSDPTDGILSQFGPIYHFDLLVPLSIFAGVAALACWRLVSRIGAVVEDRTSPGAAKALLAGALLASVLLAGAANAAVVSSPLDRNQAYADKYEKAYEPIEETAFENALVFIPTPYGDWQNHPFQYLRNDGGLDGSVVYALDRAPEDDFAVLDAYPNRTYYRYTYRGEWTANAYRHVVPKLEPLEVRRAEALDARTVVGVPDRVTRASVRVEANSEYASYSVADPGESVAVNWSLEGDRARLEAAETDSAIELDETDTVTVLVTLYQPDGSTLTYRQEATVRTSGDDVGVVWPPERYVCPLVTDCGTEGTYLPNDPDAHIDGVSFETRIDERTAIRTR